MTNNIMTSDIMKSNIMTSNIMTSTLGIKALNSHQQQLLQQQPYQRALVPVRRMSLPLEVKKGTHSGQVGLPAKPLKPVAAGSDDEKKAITSWWADPAKLSTLDPAEEAKKAFKGAVEIFNKTLTSDQKKHVDFDQDTTMMDVLNFTNNAKLSWEDKPRWKKPRKWLGHFADRVTYYGNIMDVLVQHHPEYASLAWGAMKLLFVLVVNHETSVKEIARILSRIADCLPQVDLYSMLYPSDEMRKAVATLYAHILSFLQRAADWYHSSSFSHIIKSFWRPFEVAFKDVVDEICEHGKRVTVLADAGHKQETRMIREILVPVAADVCGLKKLIDIMSGTGKELNIKDGQEQQAYCIQMTQGEFFELQNRFLASKPDQKQICQAMFEELRPCLGYVSPGFENLKISGFLGLPVQLDFPGLPKALGRLAVELKETATQFSYQIAFIFCSNETVRGYLKSPVDIAKLLVFHVLEHNPHLLLEQRKWLPMDRLQKARTVPDFLGILKDILRFIPSILFIIDSIDSYALSTVPEDQVQDTKNDIKQLSDGLNNLAQIYDNSVKIITPTTPLQSKRSSTANLSSGGLTTKLQLSGGMISWTEGGKREEFPLPRFRNQAFIMHTASALEELSDDEEVAPREPSDNEAFLKMTTPEGGSISAGTLPTGFTLPKRPSWPSNLYSIDRHKCKFQECYNPHTNERTLTTAKFPLMSGGW